MLLTLILLPLRLHFGKVDHFWEGEGAGIGVALGESQGRMEYPIIHVLQSHGHESGYHVGYIVGDERE